MRFIPAGAGNTTVLSTVKLACSVYPRWRGEHHLICGAACAVYGLSPLARGTQTPATHGHPRWRFIPAGAGNTPQAIEDSIVDRFIPAGAGNTRTRHTTARYGTVYPRWRGEHAKVGKAMAEDTGLSPLARGTRIEDKEPGRNQRFIPAGAGNTIRPRVSKSFCSVYPRWRGEHSQTQHVKIFSTGLSPLARGTLPLVAWLVGFSRFIPAGAGNTSHLENNDAMPAVYPRWRGEHGYVQTFVCGTAGLSPLARGTQLSGNAGNASHRFIPAGAGNTIAAAY